MNHYKEARKRKGISQAMLSAQIDVSQGSISQWEIGKTEPDVQNILLPARSKLKTERGTENTAPFLLLLFYHGGEWLARGEKKNGWTKSTKRAGQWLADRETAARVRHDARAARRENRLLAKRREQVGTWRTNAARRNSRENRGRVRVPNGRFDFMRRSRNRPFSNSQTFAN